MKTPFLLLLAMATSLSAAEVKIELPPETSGYKPDAGFELAQANCLTCHSAEYVSIQPRKPREYWEATVKKMREKFGAPVPPEAVPGLVQYLTASYGAH